MFKAIRIFKSFEKFEWRHKYTTLILLSFFAAYYILTSQIAGAVAGLGDLDYLGVFLAGFFFALTPTVAPATAALFVFSHFLNPIFIALIGSAGAVTSNYLLLKFFEKKFLRELKYISRELKWTVSLHLTKFGILRKMIPFVAGFILMSPLPDEFAIALLGSINFDAKKFTYYAFVLHFVGILLVASVAKLL